MNMIPLLIVGYALFMLFIYAIFKVGSDADDEMERLVAEKYAELEENNNN